jgi:hypothetical protein
MPKGPVSHASTPRGDFQGDGSYTPIVQPANVGNKLRDAFEVYVANGDRWTERWAAVTLWRLTAMLLRHPIW